MRGRKLFLGTRKMRKRELSAHECTRGTNNSDWRHRGKRRKIICTTSLLADPISGSTMNRDRRSKYAFYPIGTRDPFYGGYVRAKLFVRSHGLFSYEFLNRALFCLNKANMSSETTVPEFAICSRSLPTNIHYHDQSELLIIL